MENVTYSQAKQNFAKISEAHVGACLVKVTNRQYVTQPCFAQQLVGSIMMRCLTLQQNVTVIGCF